MFQSLANLFFSQTVKGWTCSAAFHAVALGSLTLVTIGVTAPREIVFGAKQQPFSLTLLSSSKVNPSEVSPVELQIDVLPDEARIAQREFRQEHSSTSYFEILPDVTDAAVSEQPVAPPNPSHETEFPEQVNQQQLEISLENLLVEIPGSETSLPSFEENSPPVYPGIAVARGWEGRVLLRLQIDAQGQVTEVTVLESSGRSILDAAAANAVKSWRAQPARRRGKAVATNVRLPIHFRLSRD